MLSRFRDLPADFSREVLSLTLTPTQAQILESLVDHPRVAVAAGYATGCTTAAAVATIWWASTRQPSLVVTVAPTERQLSQLLWRYIRRFAERSSLPRVSGATNWAFSPNQRALGSTDHATVFELAGQQNVLVIEDATNPPDLPYSLKLGPGGRQLKLGQLPAWHHISVTSLDAARSEVPGLVDPLWIERIRKKYGERSDFWMEKVLGTWPEANNG